MKKSIVKLLAVGMLLGGAIVPTTVTNNGFASQVTTTQTAKAATTDDQAQTISYKVLKTGTNNSSMSSQYFTKTATVTPNGDGTYKVTLKVNIPSLGGISIGVDILNMNGKPVTDGSSYNDNGKNYMDVSFDIDSLSDLSNKMTSDMKIKLGPVSLPMSVSADFVFDTSTLKPDTSTDTSKPSTDTDKDTGDKDPIIPDTNTDNGSTVLPGTDSNNSGSNVIIGTPVTTPSTSTVTDQEIPYQVLKEDPSQGESVSTQFFTGKSKVSKNDDGTYKVAMTLVYPTSFGTQPVTIDSINGGSINPDDTKYYSNDGNNYMDYSFNIKSMSDLDNLIPCTMSIDVSNLGFKSTESVNFKSNATASGVAGSSAVGTAGTSTGATGTNGSGVYGSTSGWPSGSTSGSGTGAAGATGSAANSMLPQTGNTTSSAILTSIGVLVAGLGMLVFKKSYIKD
ncbi:NEAT domain-containing protein [Companilactobacillus mishanensis]|uniref:NEAT domain-containing protein n=1 Tax=Companilactobacillus mishanensis TaxID=2486008 RepID=UPI0012952F4E|nr:NEAT domain-containing protein [Companilactobacillus mishanensis]MQS89766.1 LPXTG cell wall anchor domain-containing protein [Companilactobacillus mishanensis]